MSIIAIKGIPYKCSMIVAVESFKKFVGGQFEPLNFSTEFSRKGKKILYVRLSERLDPVQVVDRINMGFRKTKTFYNAFVPATIPDLSLTKKLYVSPKKIEKHNINSYELHQTIALALNQLYIEIQYKYPGLYNVSKKTGHKLLDTLAVKIGDRLKEVMDKHNKHMKSFDVTSWYRKTHPHSGDFQLILSTLHELQDEAEAPRINLQEAELLTRGHNILTSDNVPREKLKEALNHYSKKVSQAITAHIKTLDSKIQVGDTEQMIARKKVREEMTKMIPYLSQAMKQVVGQHFPPDDPKKQKDIRIYGEPFLPNKDALSPFTRKYIAPDSFVRRDPAMYNLLLMRVEQSNVAEFKAMDGTVVFGAKLTIRDTVRIRPLRSYIKAAVAHYFSDATQQTDDLVGDPMSEVEEE